MFNAAFWLAILSREVLKYFRAHLAQKAAYVGASLHYKGSRQCSHVEGFCSRPSVKLYTNCCICFGSSEKVSQLRRKLKKVILLIVLSVMFGQLL